MRPYLIDFLVEAHDTFALLPETLFLTINILDRYCSRRTLYKKHYQLVGCVALLIAAKYGDKKEHVPQLYQLNYMCSGRYDHYMFTQMEMHVLNSLEWAIGHPTVEFFSQVVIIKEHDDQEVRYMAAYISEIALYHRDFVSTKPSIMARASLVLAREILNRPKTNDRDWDYTVSLTLVMLSQHLSQPSLTLVRKYSTPQMLGVSRKLRHFMAEHAVIIVRNAEPPLPPAAGPLNKVAALPLLIKNTVQPWVSRKVPRSPRPAVPVLETETRL